MGSPKLNSSLYPDCWNDDERMNVLFAPFRPKSVNPENYVSKLNFWKNMIKRYCEHNGCAKFCKSELLLNFQRNEKSPYALDHVLDDMYQNKEIKTSAQFTDDIEDGWSMWAIKTFVKKPIVWGIQKTVGVIENPNVEYIFIDVIQNQASNLLTELQHLDKQIVQCDDLNSITALKLNSEGRELCLRYLHFLKKIYVEYEIRNGKKEIRVIKVPKSGLIASPLTDLEWTLLNLENAEKKLDKCIEDLHTDMKNNEDLARSYIREGKKLLAKSCLRKKHVVEKNLEKRMIARDNIHSLITNLQDAEHNGFVLNAIKLGSDTLKSLLKKSDLDLDNVDEIILEVKETLDVNDEIQQTVSQPLIDDTVDDSALEDELNEILSRSTEEEEEVFEKEKEKEAIFEKEKEKEAIFEKEKEKDEKFDKEKEDEKVKKFDEEILERLNKLGIGPVSPSEEAKDRHTPVSFHE